VRILDLAPREILPPRRGSTVRIAALMGELSRRHEVLHLTLQVRSSHGRRRAIEVVPASPTQRELRRVHPLSRALMKAGERSWHGGLMLAGLGTRLAQPARLAPLLSWADVVVVEYPWQFEVARRHLPAGTPLVYSSLNVETDKFRSWAEAAGAGRARAAPWLAYVERAERRAVAHADLVTAVSEPDRRTFVERFGAAPERTLTVPNGVDTRRFRPASAEERAAAKRALGLPPGPVVLFQGASMPANRVAVRRLRRLAALPGELTFLVAGTVSAPERSGRFLATGKVPDMRPYLTAADLAVCPIEHGGGTKLKVLESMAAGLPLVALAETLYGLEARAGEHALVAPKDERALLAELERLVREPVLAGRLAASGRRLVEERYDWKAIAAGLEDALVRLVEEGARVSPPRRPARAGPLDGDGPRPAPRGRDSSAAASDGAAPGRRAALA
jgi:polysaccharide biosynthesis protein PslH